MGDDPPPAFLSKMPLRRTVWDYCKQRFAQVTNPPIDPLREAHVMSLKTCIAHEFTLASPLVSERQVQSMGKRLERCCGIDATFESSRGLAGALQALESIRHQARWKTQGSRMVVVSDRRLSAERAALPILLAVAAVWKEMVDAGNSQRPLVVETAQALDTHHVAMLLAVGATAVCPFLALDMAGAQTAGRRVHYPPPLAPRLKKILSRMGGFRLSSDPHTP